jgi:hypothetical protein
VPGNGVDAVFPVPVIGVCVAPPIDVPSDGAPEPLPDEQATPAPMTSAAANEIDVCPWVMMTPRGNHPALTFIGLALEGAKKLSLTAHISRSWCAQFRCAAFIRDGGTRLVASVAMDNP